MFFLKERKDINAGLERFRATPNAVLVDVRNPSECKHGVIPGSINIPLNKLSMAKKLIPDSSTPVFTYCTNGGRADRAAKRLKRMGFVNCVSLGGVTGYRGEIEK